MGRENIFRNMSTLVCLYGPGVHCVGPGHQPQSNFPGNADSSCQMDRDVAVLEYLVVC